MRRKCSREASQRRILEHLLLTQLTWGQICNISALFSSLASLTQQFFSQYSELSVLSCYIKSNMILSWCDWIQLAGSVSWALLVATQPLSSWRFMFLCAEVVCVKLKGKAEKVSSPVSSAHIIPSVRLQRFGFFAVSGMCRYLNVEYGGSLGFRLSSP